MECSHMKYNGSMCEQDKIYCGKFVRGAHGSTCVQNKIFMTRLHVEHIRSACVQDRTSLLAYPLVTHNFFRLN